MKKLTVLLAIVMFILLGIQIFIEARKEPEPILDIHGSAPNINRWLSKYAGVKVRGAIVKELFITVETYNIQQVFPSMIRYGDVLPDSHEWNEYSKVSPNLNSGDIIRDSAFYEVVVQDQLEDDGYLDTIIIRAYDYK